MSRALPNTPAPLPGAVVAQYVTRCGKRHGPYWYRMWREGGRLRKAYVRPEELEAVRQACAQTRSARRDAASRRAGVRDSLGDVVFLMRMLARMERDPEESPTPDEIRRIERINSRGEGK